MRVLLVENEPGAGGTASARLTAAGVDVQRCRPPGVTDYTCEGMPTGHGCPLDGSGTDAALVVRSPEGGPVSELEAGVACALRRSIPVALVGGTSGATYLPWVSGDTGDTDDPLPALKAAARRGHTQLSDPARIAAQRALGPSGEDCPVEVSVRYRGDRLRADVRVEAPVDARTRDAIAVRVAGVLRPRALWAKVIDVVVSGAEVLEPEP